MKYLGGSFSFEKQELTEIHSRISISRLEIVLGRFWALKRFFLGDLPQYHKKSLFEYCVLPVLTSITSRTLTNEEIKRLQLEQRNYGEKNVESEHA